MLLLATALCLCPTLAQEPTTPQHVVAGEAPGSQRWIVRFQQRSFTLDALREAILTRAPANAIEAVVAGYERRVQDDQAAFVDFVRTLDARVTQQWWIVNACAVEIAPQHLPAVRQHAGVAALQPDTLRRPASFTPIKAATNARNHNADHAYAVGLRGQGVTIAVPDSGVDDNSAGSGRPHRSFFVNGNPNDMTGGGIGGSRLLVNRQMGSQSADDVLGHGTAVAACAAGEVWLSPNADFGQAPGAKIVSYSMADLANGFALLTTIVSTWQRILTDRAALNIGVANLSYEGTAIPSWIEQEAMDNAAFFGDIAIAVAGGNFGSSTRKSHGALNVLAVGAVETDTRLVAFFSVRGPIETNLQRFYPDIVANGVYLRMPMADRESADLTAQGTSFASPQIAGAMAIYRSARPQATSLETRAAVLVTAEPVAGQNRDRQDHTRNAYGHGYLRTDRLADLALAAGTLSTSGSVTTMQPNVRLAFSVTKDNWYAVALAWDRVIGNHDDWSNLDLEVSMAGASLGKSETPFNVHERVIFKAPATGTVDIEVKTVRFEVGVTVVPFGVVAGDSLPRFEPASARTFGNACAPGFGAGIGPKMPLTGTSYEGLVMTSTMVPSAVLLIGRSDQNWLGVPLPFDLTVAGAPGCNLYVSGDVAIGLAVVNQRASLTLAVPNDPSLVAATIFHQAIEPGSNALGFNFSNGLAVTIGGQLQ